MAIVGLALVVIGGILSLAGAIWFLVVAFQESVLWGLGCFFCGIVQLIFLFSNFDKAGKPFMVEVGGLVLVIIGSAISGQQ